MNKLQKTKRQPAAAAMAVAAAACFAASSAHGFKLDAGPDWTMNLDNSIQYTMGWRAQNQDPAIANHFAYGSGDAKFPKKGDMVTNRIQDLIEFDGTYRKTMGFRVSGTVFKDFAYNDSAKNSSALGGVTNYAGNTYTDATKRYFVEGGELLDAFVFVNSHINDTPVYLKLGRLTQYWGNAFFFGFSNIGYSQHPIDYIKGFANPGSEVKELFLPRKQILVAADITPELSVAAQYFFEYRANRYPESGTYLGFFDPLFNGPNAPGTLAGFGVTGNRGIVEPPNRNGNWGVKVSWSPKEVGGDIGFYYRKFDEVDPWLAQLTPTLQMQNPINQKAELIGISFEKGFGLISTGFELSQRRNTALNSTPFNVLPVGGAAAKGTLTNFIANTFVQLGTTPLWNSGILLAEMSYTHLNKVTENPSMYFGEGFASCAPPVTWRDGCSTKNSLALAMLFEPQWLQVFPGIDISAPISYTVGVKGNPAYRASGFYGERTNIYSLGAKFTYQGKTTLAIQYNGYKWRTNTKGTDPISGQQTYQGNNFFGGIGAVGINDRGWLQVTLKTSF